MPGAKTQDSQVRLRGKKILVGITGGIAAYKVISFIRMLIKDGAQVKAVLTPNALEFVTKKTLEAITRNPVYMEQFAPTANTEHISLAQWADMFIVSPLTANTLSKFATGICDNLLTSVFCAFFGESKPVILAPAMNNGMWKNPFVQENIKKLTNEGCTIMQPEIGYLACGEIGIGRLCKIENIFEAVIEGFNPHNNKLLEGKKIIVTAGGTKEAIDPVRYISNSSSGKMGTAIADMAYAMGADVELISTFDTEKKYKVTVAQTAQEMLEAIHQSFPGADSLIMAAAVADYRVKDYSNQKINSFQGMTLELIKNPDILEGVCKTKTSNQIVVGFCLATENAVNAAKIKIDKKCCDFIVANEAKTALGTDETEVWVIDKAHNVKKLEKDSKMNIARRILEQIYDKTNETK